MTLADELAKWLVERGITTGFGIIGGGNIVLWDAICRLDKTRLVSVHHEQAAAMSASYFARSSGRIGLALVTTGAGSANAITGVLAAHMDGSALLVISGNEAARYMNAKTRVWGVQGYDSAAVVQPITKSAVRLFEPASAIDEMERAYALALAAPQGPVWVDIPKDVQSAAL